jgi:hypothetical protein
LGIILKKLITLAVLLLAFNASADEYRYVSDVTLNTTCKNDSQEVIAGNEADYLEYRVIGCVNGVWRAIGGGIQAESKPQEIVSTRISLTENLK